MSAPTKLSSITVYLSEYNIKILWKSAQQKNPEDTNIY